MQKTITNTHKIIVKHLRQSRFYGKHILKVTNEYGSVIIKHSIHVETKINKSDTMITELNFLPIVRLYKKGNKIINDENLINEDLEKWE